MSSRVRLMLFIALTLGVGTAIGWLARPDAWYFTLRKPSFAPPDAVFAPVWTILYVLLAVVGWRLHERDPRALSSRLWRWQLALNYLWSPLFFRAHQMAPALLDVAVMITMTVILIRRNWRMDRASGLLLLPYLAWTAFAFALNASFLALNGGAA